MILEILPILLIPALLLIGIKPPNLVVFVIGCFMAGLGLVVMTSKE